MDTLVGPLSLKLQFAARLNSCAHFLPHLLENAIVMCLHLPKIYGRTFMGFAIVVGYVVRDAGQDKKLASLLVARYGRDKKLTLTI